MSLRSIIREVEAEKKRRQREAKNRQRDLERQTREKEKLSSQQQARLEVETFENALDVLLSMHREQTDAVDWPSLAASLPPPPPVRRSHNELKARQRLAITASRKEDASVVDRAKHEDDLQLENAVRSYADEHSEWVKLSNLARRILSGDSTAYIEAIQEFNPFAELAGIGSSLHFTIHHRQLVEVVITSNGRKAIPAEIKSLTASGKVSAKAMPKARFIELYQAYACGCVLRVARELFALLPASTLLLSASAEALETATGRNVERPFLSVVISRETFGTLDFDRLDPSDAIMAMPHRGDLKTSRKTGDFEFIVPLTTADLPLRDASTRVDCEALRISAQRLRADLAAQCSVLIPGTTEPMSLPDHGETE